MNFADERDLERHVRRLIAVNITAQHPEVYALDNKKAVDIVICRDGSSPSLFFLETKLFDPQHGRMGIGSSKGAGCQPEIVRRKPAYFEANLRWIVVDSRETIPKFLFVPTSTIRKYLAGNAIGEKFNNIQLRIFKEVESLTEIELVAELKQFVLPVALAANRTG